MILPQDTSWLKELEEEFSKSYFKELASFVDAEYSTKEIYPPRELIFNAFNLTPFDEVKVVILGQDPYHEPGQAQGIAFYVPETIKMPPSLKNISKELGHTPNLLDWAGQGVLLMNATLTVEAHKATSHEGRGWEIFTDAVISKLSEKRDNLVFILWGGYARSKAKLIDRKRHHIIETAHPSPLSAYRGFFGSKPFERANEFLTSKGVASVNW